jgi:hypothetical protein
LNPDQLPLLDAIIAASAAAADNANAQPQYIRAMMNDVVGQIMTS